MCDIEQRLSADITGMELSNHGGICGVVVIMERAVITQHLEWLHVRVENTQPCLDFRERDRYAIFGCPLCVTFDESKHGCDAVNICRELFASKRRVYV